MKRKNQAAVSVLRFSPDAGCIYLAVGGEDGSLEVYEVEGKEGESEQMRFKLILEESGVEGKLDDSGAQELETFDSNVDLVLRSQACVASLDWSTVKKKFGLS